MQGFRMRGAINWEGMSARESAMKDLRTLLALIILSAVIGSGTASASLEEVKDGVWVEDFEDGLLLDWEVTGESDAELTEDEGNSLLAFSGAGQVTLADMKFKDFAVEVTIKGGGGGIRFGGKYRAFITTYFGGSLRVSGERKELALLKRGYKIGRSYRLKVVCFGSFIQVYVNGRKEFEKSDASPARGPIALVTGKKGALLDDVRISTRLSPEEGAVAVPEDDDQTLLFSSAVDAELQLKSANYSDRDVQLVVAVRHFKATSVPDPADNASAAGAGGKGSRGANSASAKSRTIVKYGTQYYFAIETLPDKTVATSKAILKAKSKGSLKPNLGRIPPGFYMLELSFLCNGKEQSNRKYPFAVFEDTEPVEYRAPVIPVGTYTHKMPKAMKEENPLWWNTHLHAVALTLKKHNLNIVVAPGAYASETVDVFQRYGVSVLERGSHGLDHPAVIGTLAGDEPHASEMDFYRAQYGELEKKTDKPVMTCCVGEGIGLGGKYFFWKEFNPRVRIFRWYGIKKHFYGIHHHLIYKGILPFHDVLRISYASFDTPYWAILPSNGDKGHEAYFQYPSPAQHRGMMHLAVAYGARGILLYSLQAGFGTGLVNTVTLKPNGENLAAIGEVAGNIKKHARLIRSLEVGKLDVRCASPDIEPVPLHDSKDGRYVYAINRNTKETVSCRLFWPLKLKRAKVMDIFAGKSVSTETDEFFMKVPLKLAPGEGRLLSVSKVDQ